MSEDQWPHSSLVQSFFAAKAASLRDVCTLSRKALRGSLSNGNSGSSKVLRTDDQEISITTSAAEIAMNAIPKLQEALRAWVLFTQKGDLRE